jgi:glycosyltransferase involved in cell wall biosynthesis
MFPYRGARHVFVAHIPLFRQTLAQRLRSAVKSSAVSAFAAGRDFRFVAVSEWKRASWGRQGVVVPFFPVPFAASLVSSARAPDVPVAVVANRIVERGEELGLGLVEEIRKRVPLRIIGANPDLAGAHVPSDFAEFVRLFSECAVYLYTIEHPHGDGYNTSMLEAMSLGMPVVTVPNPTSPIVHGVNGLVGRGADELVAHIETLRADRLLRERIGAAAKATVEARFTRERFLSAWREALFDHG